MCTVLPVKGTEILLKMRGVAVSVSQFFLSIWDFEILMVKWELLLSEDAETPLPQLMFSISSKPKIMSMPRTVSLKQLWKTISWNNRRAQQKSDRAGVNCRHTGHKTEAHILIGYWESSEMGSGHAYWWQQK